jgi:alpha 1,3-glucosidase
MAPFFRAHAHIDTKRREPYLLASPYKDIVYNILRLRYSMLPVWYTAFRETTVTGRPILRPQYVVFPKDKNGFDIDDQYYIGSSGLLVKPVTEKDVTETTVYFSDNQVYYDYFTFATYNGKGSHVTVPAALHQLPLFIRGGSIVSTRERPRRASSLMKYDPFTLRVALNKDGEAKGDLYLDDGETYNHQKGEYVWREFVAEKKTRNSLRISSRDLGSLKPTEAVGDVSLTVYNPKNKYAKTLDEKDVRVEKILVLGLKSNPKSVKAEGTGEELTWEFMPAMTRAASTLVIKDPRAKITDDWAVLIQY